jgi:hypothetical protein
MSTPEKLSWFVGLQLYIVGLVLAAFWISGRVAAYTSKIPPELLFEHRNRMKLGFMILGPLYLVVRLTNDLSYHSHFLELASDVLIVLVCINCMVRSGLTIYSKKEIPGRLKQLAWVEMVLALLAGLAFILFAFSGRY